MIIKARHHWFFYPFFKVYSRYLPRFDFREVNYIPRHTDSGLPVLMIGNHFSWWDGFIAQHINLKFFHRKFHIMMLEEQLSSRMFLNKTGAYSIKKGHRSMVETFNYTGELLTLPGNMVVMYPQGSIHSLYDRPLRFEKGWFRILEKAENPVQLVFYIALVDYFSHRRPTLNIYLYDYDHNGKGPGEVEQAFNRYYEKSIEHQRSWL